MQNDGEYIVKRWMVFNGISRSGSSDIALLVPLVLFLTNYWLVVAKRGLWELKVRFIVSKRLDKSECM